LSLELLVQLERLLDAQRLLTGEENSRIVTLQKKLRALIKGGPVGTPRIRIKL